MEFVFSFQSECLKIKRTLAFWVVLAGGLFTPLIIIVARLLQFSKLKSIYEVSGFWQLHWKNCWESMAIFLLPLGAILLTSLITQLEFKNNTWKQAHTLPLRYVTIYFSKLLIVLLLLLAFLVIFNLGIFSSAVVPWLFMAEVDLQFDQIPVESFLIDNVKYYIYCLPIISIQYLIGLRFRNFIVSMGAGFLLWVGALASLTWKYGIVFPYTYVIYNYLKDSPGGRVILPDSNLFYWSTGYFIITTIAGFVLYALSEEKG